MRDAFVAALETIAAENSNVWLLCGDLGFSLLEGFMRRFPDRFINVGIAEQNMAGIAAGLGLSGKTVFTYSIGNFATLRCLEQLRNDVCYHCADVKVVSVGGGYAYGNQGYTHHAIEDLAVMSSLPSMDVFVPSDPMEVRAAMSVIASSGGPAYLRLGRAGEPVLDARPISDIRRLRILREGHDLAMLASGPVVGVCLTVADLLLEHELKMAVASVPCLRPFDCDGLLELVHDLDMVVTVEEHIRHGGLAAAVAQVLAELRAHPKLLALSIPDPAAGKASISGNRDALLARAGLSPEGIVTRVLEAL